MDQPFIESVKRFNRVVLILIFDSGTNTRLDIFNVLYNRRSKSWLQFGTGQTQQIPKRRRGSCRGKLITCWSKKNWCGDNVQGRSGLRQVTERLKTSIKKPPSDKNVIVYMAFGMLRESGRRIQEKSILVDYFRNLFTISNPPHVNAFTENIERRVTADMNSNLFIPCTERQNIALKQGTKELLLWRLKMLDRYEIARTKWEGCELDWKERDGRRNGI